MKNPFIQLETVAGDLVSINLTKIVSVTKQTYTDSNKHYTYLIVDGGYITAYHFKLQYEEVIEIINSWYRYSGEIQL